MSVIKLLRNDHRRALSLIEQIENDSDEAAGRSRVKLFDELKAALSLYAQVEERIFYPALEKFDETSALVAEFYREHQEADRILLRRVAQQGQAARRPKPLRRGRPAGLRAGRRPSRTATVSPCLCRPRALVTGHQTSITGAETSELCTAASPAGGGPACAARVARQQSAVLTRGPRRREAPP